MSKYIKSAENLKQETIDQKESLRLRPLRPVFNIMRNAVENGEFKVTILDSQEVKSVYALVQEFKSDLVFAGFNVNFNVDINTGINQVTISWE